MDPLTPMPVERTEFEQLIAAARDGCEASSRRLLVEYGPHVRRAVRRNLHPRLRTVFDTMDFEQEVWASFFASNEDQPPFRDGNELAQFLVRMAGNKVTDEFRRRLYRAKRNMNRETALETCGGTNAEVKGVGEATPSQHAVADETWRLLLERHGPMVRRILEMRRDGCSYPEIAEATGLHLKVIQRQVRKAREGHDE